MKKLTSIVRFTGMLFVFVLLIYGMGLFSPTTTSASDNERANNSRLLSENFELKARYKLLEERLDEIEKNFSEINYYDKYIYASLNGVNPDSVDIMNYDTIDINNYSFIDKDSIFRTIDAESMFIAKMIATQLEDIKNTSEIIKKNKYALNYYPNVSPIKTKDLIEITSTFGWRVHPIYKTALFHEGVDISANPRTPVYATAQGKVDYIMYSKYGYGNRVVIKHAYGYETLYAHLGDDIQVRKGQSVKKGQLIGTVSSTGTSTGPHLHYEVRLNSEYKDPLGYFYTYLTEELIAKNEMSL